MFLLKLSTHLPVAAEWQVYRQAEQVVNKVLEGWEQMPHLLLWHPESQQHPHRHGERQPLALPVEKQPIRTSVTSSIKMHCAPQSDNWLMINPHLHLQPFCSCTSVLSSLNFFFAKEHALYSSFRLDDSTQADNVSLHFVSAHDASCSWSQDFTSWSSCGFVCFLKTTIYLSLI